MIEFKAEIKHLRTNCVSNCAPSRLHSSISLILLFLWVSVFIWWLC